MWILIVVGLNALDVHEDIIQPARKYVGSRYCPGSASPPCFDCSGFVYHLYSPYVPSLPRVSRHMARVGKGVSQAKLQPGDLVFFATSPAAGVVSHVAISLGNNAIIHAISDGPERGVHVTPLNARYWRTHYHSAVRILPAQAVAEATEEAGAAQEHSRQIQPRDEQLLEEQPKGETSTTPAESPWDQWDGYVYGDYESWRAHEEQSFEEWKRQQRPNN